MRRAARLCTCFALPLLASTGLAACKRQPVQAPVAQVIDASSAPVEEADLAKPTQYPAPRPWPPPDLMAPVVVSTLNGDPKGPKQSDFDAPQAEISAKVQGCFDALPASAALPGGIVRLGIRYDVGSDGRTKDVAITGEMPADALACTKAAIEALPFPKFGGSPVHSTFSATYSRPQRPDLAVH